MEVAKLVYEQTRTFPKEERYGLALQLNKSAVSVPSNIAEGAGRNTKNDFRHFISIALGSSFELETQLILAGEFKLVPETTLKPILVKLDGLQRMINKFWISLG